ncbi:outer membrane receptor protein involved in Fe transport [Sinobacterium caligoides]|uniref:Outer membrane receptor protein involved in Fe transport n=2 Tax=Sinobacterium caligoides TaxID=933926 RepID=A0A3N2DNV8_9GAMM|nr:outer membrane receptor protein involved in Fe transport [Sinobacterium caligoides]
MHCIKFLPWVFASNLLLTLDSSTCHAETVKKIAFKLSPLPLNQALIELGKQAGLPIIFAPEMVVDKFSPELTGTISLADALTTLLTNSELAYEVVESRFIVITEAANKAEEVVDNRRNAPQPLENIYVYGNYVTGSRIRRSDFEGYNPVDILDRSELNLIGTPTVSAQLRSLPAVTGKPSSSAVTNGGDASANVTLRGLPANNTLVLVNGRRVANNGLDGDSVNLNTIPNAAIERIEVLKDGASAIYGADAIAGVVNIVLREQFDGLEISTYGGQTGQNDLQTLNTELLWGKNFDRGSIVFSASLFDQQGIMSSDRDYAANSDGRSWGGSDQRSAATPAARIKLSDGRVVTANNVGNANNLAGYRLAETEDLYNYSEQTSAYRPRQQQSLYSHMQLDLSDQLTAFIELGYDSTESENQLAPTPIFTKFETQRTVVAADNPYNIFGEELDDVRRRMTELGPRQQYDREISKRFSTGLRGQNGSWLWDAGYSWSRSDAEQQFHNLVDGERLRRGLGSAAQCTGDCIPVNLLGPAGSLSRAESDYLRTTARSEGSSKIDSLTVNLSGPWFKLPAGTVDVAAGAELRNEAIDKTADPLSSRGGVIGGNNFVGAKGQRTIQEFYVEANLPILRHQLGLQSLELQTAARHSYYSDFGATTTPKLGLKARINPSWLLRSTYSKGFRAPSLKQMHQIDSQDYVSFTDPCAEAANVGRLPGCQQQADGSRKQFLALFGGNPQLKPETSTSYTFGVVYTPTYLSGLQAAVDLYHIKQRDVVDANAMYIAYSNAETGAFNELVQRDENGDIKQIIARYNNAGSRDVSGLDISTRYRWPETSLGNFAINLDASHIHRFERQLFANSQSRNIAGSFVDDATNGLGALPKWKGRIGASWQHLAWQANYTLNYVGHMTELHPDGETEREIEAWTTHNLQLSYTLPVLAGLKLLAGVDNLFDEKPPLIASALNDNIDARTHNLKGRYFYLSATQRF